MFNVVKVSTLLGSVLFSGKFLTVSELFSGERRGGGVVRKKVLSYQLGEIVE